MSPGATGGSRRMGRGRELTDTTAGDGQQVPQTSSALPKDSMTQAWVAFTIVICITLIALGSLYVGWSHQRAEAFTLAGTAIGILGNALQAPSGIGAVISSALGKKPADPPK